MVTNKERDLELWRAYKRAPSNFTLKPLMRQMDPVIQNEVNKWSGAIARPVLEAKAKKLAVEAFDTYQEGRGAALATHLTNRLQKLSRTVYTYQDAVRVPEHRKLKVNSYMRAHGELMSEHGREPTNQELQDHLKWSPKLISDVQGSMAPELLQSEDVGGGLFERQSVWAPDSDEGAIDMVYFDLNPQDKLILEHTTGYSGKPILSNSAITQKLGITQAQLSYRKKKIREKLEQAMQP